MLFQIAEYNFAVYFLSNALWNLNFGPIFTNLEPFIGWVPERSKTIIMNIGLKIPLIFDKQPNVAEGSNSITSRKNPTM